MKTSIALIGFMGTGKTVVGEMLAAKIGKRFIELDAEIAREAGKSIPDIFQQDGESHFRELEIACGGGIVLNEINIFRLKQNCVIVCLSASSGEILKRVSADKNSRPLLDVPDRGKRVKTLLESRRSLYERAADFTVDTSGIDAPGVVSKIISALDKYESHDK
jgi:shikimate kinase